MLVPNKSLSKAFRGGSTGSQFRDDPANNSIIVGTSEGNSSDVGGGSTKAKGVVRPPDAPEVFEF